MNLRGILALLVACSVMSAGADAPKGAVVAVDETLHFPVQISPGQRVIVQMLGSATEILDPLSVVLRLPGSPEIRIAASTNSVRNLCLNPSLSRCTSLMDIGFDVPLNIGVNWKGSMAPLKIFRLSISSKDGESSEVEVMPVSDKIGILGACKQQYLCQEGPVVFHKDGRPVSASYPAIAGEEVNLLATGLPLDKAMLTGGFQFAVNAPPRKLLSVGSPPCPNPVECPALTIRSSALEGSPVSQIRFLIPQVPSGLAKCARSLGAGGEGIRSNFTFVLAGPNSFDGVLLCVEVRSPQ